MRLRHKIQLGVMCGLTVGAALLATASPTGAATAPSLGTAASFGVLGATTVTNTGATSITGDLGVSPGLAITDLGTITVSGSTHPGDSVALAAQNDVITAYNALGGEPCTQSFTGTAVEIGGQTLVPGVYCYSSSALLTGTLTLNGAGVYIFKTGSTLTTAAGSSVSLIGGALPCNVFWQIGSSADLFTNTAFVGSILALTNINLQNGTSIAGRALARNAAVNMDTNVITSSSCALAATATPTATATATALPATATAIAATATSAAATATSAAATSTSVAATQTAAVPTAAVPTAAVPTATRPAGTLGPPPASQLEQSTPGTAPTPGVTPPAPTPGLPRLPRTGDAPTQGRSSLWTFVLLASAATGSVALGFGIRAHQGRAR